MKILGLSFSPHLHGNTVVLMEEALKGARLDGAETELYSVSGKNLQPCDGCRTCLETGECHIQDDMQELYQKMLAADGIIFGTPVYSCNMTAQGKIIMDRSFALTLPEKNLSNKVGGVIVVGGSLGLADTIKDLIFNIVTNHMLATNFIAAYAPAEGDVYKLTKCLKATNDLGRQMVKLIALDFKYPEEFPPMPGAFGTHTF
jgi:multimeric flavodoxin WrbA